MIKFFTTGIGNVEGIFSFQHLIYTIISIVIIIGVLLLTKNKEINKINKLIKIIAISFLILEILKILWNIFIREEKIIDDYIPLYFCSLFIYTSLIYSYYTKEESIIYKFSKSFLIYGGFAGGVAFIVFPTTSLQVFPLWHVLSIHSLIYHSFMVICAIWLIKEYKVKHSDFKLYFIALIIIQAVVIIINLIFDINLMFLNNPSNIGILEFIYKYLKYVYPILIAIGQILLSFYFAFGIYKIIELIKRKNIE